MDEIGQTNTDTNNKTIDKHDTFWRPRGNNKTLQITMQNDIEVQNVS